MGPPSDKLSNLVLLKRVFRPQSRLTSRELGHKRAGISKGLSAMRVQEGCCGNLLLVFNENGHRRSSTSV